MDAGRKIAHISRSRPTLEGAGVRLKRVFGFDAARELDPFLLLDEFHSHNPEDYMAGFPWHQHEGVVTVTYMLAGEIEHGDSLGNRGVIGEGDTQWMTAGSGITHQEMPRRQKDEFRGLQLWLNLPAERKKVGPGYQEIKSDQAPVVRLDASATVKVLRGEFRGTRGPAVDIAGDPQYFDIRVGPDTEFVAPVDPEHTVFAYILDGRGYFDADAADPLGAEHLVVFGAGASVEIRTGNDEGVRFMLASGRPFSPR